MFSEIKKGKNPMGGTYGDPKKAPEGYGFGNGGRTQSLSPEVHSKKVMVVDRYNHSQVDPIIVRGDHNVHPNHLSIRNYSIM